MDRHEKEAYSGEFSWEREVECPDEPGAVYLQRLTVPWTVIKDIMKKIKAFGRD